MAANSKMIGCKIRFVTHDDNKDHDTILNVAVRNKVSLFLSQDLAEGLNLGGDMEFVDPSTHEFDLALKSPATTIADIGFPVVDIHIQPKGNDRWIFDYTVSLSFEGGQTFSSSKTGVILDQNNKDFTGVFQA